MDYLPVKAASGSGLARRAVVSNQFIVGHVADKCKDLFTIASSTIYGGVSTIGGMQKVKERPGAKKGVSKPRRHVLDDGFPGRLRDAMGNMSVTALAKAAKCSRQSIHNYLNGGNKTIEVQILFPMARALNVSAEWLVLGTGEKSPKQSLTKDQQLALNTLSILTADERSEWISQGITLHQQSRGLPPSRK